MRWSQSGCWLGLNSGRSSSGQSGPCLAARAAATIRSLTSSGPFICSTETNIVNIIIIRLGHTFLQSILSMHTHFCFLLLSFYTLYSAINRNYSISFDTFEAEGLMQFLTRLLSQFFYKIISKLSFFARALSELNHST
jgi:hypothetical protein